MEHYLAPAILGFSCDLLRVGMKRQNCNGNRHVQSEDVVRSRKVASQIVQQDCQFRWPTLCIYALSSLVRSSYDLNLNSVRDRPIAPQKEARGAATRYWRVYGQPIFCR